MNFLLDISGIQKNMTTTDLIAGAELESVELVSWGLVWQLLDHRVADKGLKLV